MTKTQLHNISLAVAIGCLRSVAETLPERTRKHGLCIRIADKVHKNAYKLGVITAADVALLSKVITQSSEVINTFEQTDTNNMLLNMAAFCMEEIKHILSKGVFDNLQLLFDAFDGSEVYSEIRLGDRCFQRLISELEIETATGR